ncbi:hypothetical protein [Metabacillus halosaccharovorans]|uniref:hypothetical protein n=1 Tax=Metabacillus halosaccharovorans TaxID=930124 RepID=UPI000995C857|nr:hypothetical protein [Metabacillus halosaccharovorans]
MRIFSCFLSGIVLFILTGCMPSSEEIKKETIESGEQAFLSKKQKSNETSNLFSYYLPEDFQVKEMKKANVLLEKGNQSFILFVNQNEDESSKVSYETLAEQYKEPFISETFERDNEFGYIFVVKIDKNLYEVTVGLGGTKLTTESEAHNLHDDVQVMMEIVKSVQ